MITCKICEKEVIEDLLGPHSEKCRDFTEYRDALRGIVANMELHGDKASTMRNSLETYATKQQKKNNKRTSSRDLLDVSISGHLKSSNNIPAGMSPATSKRLNDTDFSEDGSESALNHTQLILEKTISTQETLEGQDDLGKKLSDEEKKKVLEEVKKSMFVLKEVIRYAKSIADWALEMTSVCEVGLHTQAELEALAKEIVDANILNFLQVFLADIEAYNLLRAKYVEANNELMKLNSEKSTGRFLKPSMKKSQSFKNKNEGLSKGAIFGMRPKAEEPSSAVLKKKESPGLEKRKLALSVTPIDVGTGSPSLEKRKLLSGANPAEINTASPNLEKRKLSQAVVQNEIVTASPNLEKRKLSVTLKDGDVGGTSPSLSKKGSIRQLPREAHTTKPSILTMFASPSMKSMKTDISKTLLQTNVNHMSMSSLGAFVTPKKNPEDFSDLSKNLLQTNVNHMASAFATPRRNPEDSNIRDKLKATMNLNFVDRSPRNLEIGQMSPNSSRRDLSSKKTIGKMNLNNPNTPISAFGKGPTRPTESGKSPAKRGTSPTNAGGGMGWFKNIRNEDTAVLSKFASPVPTRSTNPNSEDEGTPKKPANNYLDTNLNLQKPPKKIDSMRDILESPSMMKGYYSDCNASRSRKRISRVDSNDVTLDDFEFIKFIGKGAYGTVWLVKKKATGAHYAMKMVDYADRGTQNRLKALKEEKDIYQALEGDFVVKAFWTFDYDNSICFVTEYMLGGDFCKILDRLTRLDEPQAQFYMAELVHAVESLHKLGVVHRDLKPDNILMDEKGHIRLTDFGLSQKGINRIKGNSTPTRKNSTSPHGSEDVFAKARVNMLNKLCKNSPATVTKKVEFKQKALNLKKSQTLFGFLGKDDEYQRVSEKKPMFNKRNVKESPGQGDKKPKMVGTPDYMAPEIIAPEKYDMEGYDEKNMDWWSMGVILYQLLVGITPFCDTSVEAVFDNIKEHRIEFPEIGDEEDCISHNAYDLITKLLNPDYKKRLGSKGVEEVKNHPFFKGIDWATLREREAPIIPCSLEEQQNEENETATPATGKDSDMALTSTPSQGMAITRSKTAKPLQFGGFQMRRLDLLDKANQETHKELVRQKSGKINLNFKEAGPSTFKDPKDEDDKTPAAKLTSDVNSPPQGVTLVRSKTAKPFHFADLKNFLD